MIIKDHKDKLNKELSLVEQKKVQWAKEREEMAKLELYHSKVSQKYEKNSIRTQLITNGTEILQQNNQQFHNKNFNVKRVRSPTLPPIDKTVMRQNSNNSDQSSGYLSGGNALPTNISRVNGSTNNNYEYNYPLQPRLEHDNETNNNHHIQGHMKSHKNSSKMLSLSSSLNGYSSSNNDHEMDFNNINSIHTPSSETSSIASHDIHSMSSYANSSAVESASMGYQKYREGGRAKWGSYLFDSFSKDSGRTSRNTNGPSWLEKKLNESRDSEEETMSISVQSVSSFLRGQNVPLDPMDLAEREKKRRKAMDLQNAIKEQLLERENKKKMEKEKQWQQEKLEEERLAKQMELELQRLELDRQLQNEKLQSERMRQETMRLALEKAAFEAQFDRERKKRERALANSLDETIYIQKVGEKTEIVIEGVQKSISEKEPTTDFNDLATKTLSQTTVQQQQHHKVDESEEDDGETMLIGTPIKLKKKNLDSYRKKLFAKRQQQADHSKSTSDEDVSTLKCNTHFSDTSSEKSTIRPMPQKTLSDLDEIALVLQSMPMVPFVPLSNDVFALNQYSFNNLALLMASHQNRLNAQKTMFPFTASLDEKQDFNKVSASQPIPTPIVTPIPTPIVTPIPNFSTNQIQQTTQKSPCTETDEHLLHSERYYNLESAIKITQINESARNNFVSEATQFLQVPVEQEIQTIGTQDAFTSTTTENEIIRGLPQQEIKILTPKKYRDVKQPLNLITVGTQTESFLYCDYCCFKLHQHHQQHNCNANFSQENELNSFLSNQEVNKLKDKNKIEDRPRWGSRVPPIKYVKASDKDPFYASMKNRKKRYMKKSDKDIYEEGVCYHKDCPLISINASAPLLNRQFVKANNKNFCSDILPIKTDKNGIVYLL